MKNTLNFNVRLKEAKGGHIILDDEGMKIFEPITFGYYDVAKTYYVFFGLKL